MKDQLPQPFGLSVASKPRLELMQVWRQRYERDIAPGLMRFVQHSTFEARYQAAIFLGHLEYAPAEEPLRAMLERPTGADEVGLGRGYDPRRLRLQFVLARIHARDLKGLAKVESVAAAIERSVDALTPRSMGMAFDAVMPDEVVYHEVFELLYGMARQGEDIAPLRSRLRTIDHGDLLLDGATLPPDAEAAKIVDYVKARDIGMGGALPKHLANIGPRAHELLLERLQDMLAHPERHFTLKSQNPRYIHRLEEEERNAALKGEVRELSRHKKPYYALGYGALFWAASLSDDARFLPVLKQLREKFRDDPNDPDSWVSDSAGAAQKHLQARLQVLQPPDEASGPL